MGFNNLYDLFFKKNEKKRINLIKTYSVCGLVIT